jgi:hypothetical protein
MKGRFETLVALDDLVQVGLVDGAHTDGETHLYILYFISLINSLMSL